MLQRYEDAVICHAFFAATCRSTNCTLGDAVKAWLDSNLEWLSAAVLLSILTSTAIGLKQGSKGPAIFVSNLAAALMAIALYPLLEKWGYAGPFVGLLALFCGACGMALFGVLIALSNMIDRRRDRIAGGLIDRVVPEAREP